MPGFHGSPISESINNYYDFDFRFYDYDYNTTTSSNITSNNNSGYFSLYCIIF